MCEFCEVTPGIWEKKQTGEMLVSARYFGNKELFVGLDKGVSNQLTNMASMQGIQDYAIAMPDAHWGYGFPIGGVSAFDLKEGLISPGGIGFDINCGMRLITTNLTEEEVKPKIKELVDYLYALVPSGVGSKGYMNLKNDDFYELLHNGAKWCTENGFGEKKELEKIEENGKIKNSDYEKAGDKAIKRGIRQVGTLGSGNHYLEIQRIEKIQNEKAAKGFGIDNVGTIAIMIHCGSRGFGHQIATEYVKEFDSKLTKYNIELPDRQLAALPYESEEGQNYLSAMGTAANYAFANRQVIGERVKKAFKKVFGNSTELNLVYDVSHNIGKIEKYKTSEGKKDLLVHRKGATRSFPAGHKDLSGEFKKHGQPVIIGGSMQTGSYLLKGEENSMELSFGSTAHGSGRTMSRVQAKKEFNGKNLQQKMLSDGIYVKTASYSGLAEEAGSAYKDINLVVESLELTNISSKVCYLKPIGNIKG